MGKKCDLTHSFAAAWKHKFAAPSKSLKRLRSPPPSPMISSHEFIGRYPASFAQGPNVMVLMNSRQENASIFDFRQIYASNRVGPGHSSGWPGAVAEGRRASGHHRPRRGPSCRIATEVRLDALLESVVTRVGGGERPDTEVTRRRSWRRRLTYSVERARPGLVARGLGAKWS